MKKLVTIAVFLILIIAGVVVWLLKRGQKEGKGLVGNTQYGCPAGYSNYGVKRSPHPNGHCQVDWDVSVVPGPVHDEQGFDDAWIWDIKLFHANNHKFAYDSAPNPNSRCNAFPFDDPNTGGSDHGQNKPTHYPKLLDRKDKTVVCRYQLNFTISKETGDGTAMVDPHIAVGR